MWPDDEISNNYLRCDSSHLSSFSPGLFEAPNTIDFNYVFTNAHFDNNLSVYVALLAILVTFVLLLLYTAFKDQQDAHRLRSMPLSDNERNDQYVYEILVTTGYGSGGSTDSRVSFVLMGDESRTDVRDMICEEEKHIRPFRNGQTDSFIMTCKQ